MHKRTHKHLRTVNHSLKFKNNTKIIRKVYFAPLFKHMDMVEVETKEDDHDLGHIKNKQRTKNHD